MTTSDGLAAKSDFCLISEENLHPHHCLLNTQGQRDKCDGVEWLCGLRTGWITYGPR